MTLLFGENLTVVIPSVFYMSVQKYGKNDLEFTAHFEKKIMLQTICRSIKILPSGA